MSSSTCERQTSLATVLGNAADVIALMGPEIAKSQALGVTALVECSAVGVGRRADILRAISEATGFPIIVPTGIYREPWVPAWAHVASEDVLALWMQRELEGEIERTGVRAGWIKLSAGDDHITPCEAKILRAATRASLATGAIMGSHTIRGRVWLMSSTSSSVWRTRRSASSGPTRRTRRTSPSTWRWPAAAHGSSTTGSAAERATSSTWSASCACLMPGSATK